MLRKWTAQITSGIGQDRLPALYSAEITEMIGAYGISFRYSVDIFRVFSDGSKKRLDDMIELVSERSAKSYAREILPKPDSGRIQWTQEEAK